LGIWILFIILFILKNPFEQLNKNVIKLDTKLNKENVVQNRIINQILDQNDSLIMFQLIKIIQKNQAKYIKESYGEESFQCFTDKDLKSFMSKNILSEIKSDLKLNNEFISLVISTKKLTPDNWLKLIKISRSTYKPTWADNGKISKEGQTNAGQVAERAIANEIVNLVIELRKKSDDELRKMYK